MNTSRNHPASPNRKSKGDMMTENQSENLEKRKESRKMEGDDKGVKDHQKIDKIVGRKKFDKIGGLTKLWKKIKMGDNQNKE